MGSGNSSEHLKNFKENFLSLAINERLRWNVTKFFLFSITSYFLFQLYPFYPSRYIFLVFNPVLFLVAFLGLTSLKFPKKTLATMLILFLFPSIYQTPSLILIHLSLVAFFIFILAWEFVDWLTVALIILSFVTALNSTICFFSPVPILFLGLKNRREGMIAGLTASFFISVYVLCNGFKGGFVYIPSSLYISKITFKTPPIPFRKYAPLYFFNTLSEAFKFDSLITFGKALAVFIDEPQLLLQVVTWGFVGFTELELLRKMKEILKWKEKFYLTTPASLLSSILILAYYILYSNNGNLYYLTLFLASTLFMSHLYGYMKVKSETTKLKYLMKEGREELQFLTTQLKKEKTFFQRYLLELNNLKKGFEDALKLCRQWEFEEARQKIKETNKEVKKLSKEITKTISETEEVKETFENLEVQLNEVKALLAEKELKIKLNSYLKETQSLENKLNELIRAFKTEGLTPKLKMGIKSLKTEITELRHGIKEFLGLRSTVLIDGSNVALYGTSEGEPAKLENIKLLLKEVHRNGFEPITIVDASLRYRINKREEFQSMLNSGEILQAPAKRAADEFILDYADRENLPVISNDTYKEYREKYPWVNEPTRKITFMIIGETVIFNPSLQTLKKRRILTQ